jgi:hypothetical protein
VAKAGLQLRVQRRFKLQIDRNMQQRAGRRDLDTIKRTRLHHGLQIVQYDIEIGAPDIAAIDHPERQYGVGG